MNGRAEDAEHHHFHPVRHLQLTTAQLIILLARALHRVIFTKARGPPADARRYEYDTIREAKTFFSKPFPLQPFFFFFGTDYTIPQTFTVTSIA